MIILDKLNILSLLISILLGTGSISPRHDSLGDAIHSLDVPDVKYYLDKGVDPNSIDVWGNPAIMYLFRLQYYNRGRDLKEESARARARMIARILFEHGANVNAKGRTLGNTILYEVIFMNREQIKKGDFELVKILLDYGADPTIPNDYGENALDQARRRIGNREFTALLESYVKKKK